MAANKAPGEGDLYGYTRASTDKQVLSPKAQETTIAEYAMKHFKRPIKAFYVDTATSGKKPLFEREAGGQLMVRLRRGDHVIVARLDRLSRSFIGFARILESWEKLEVGIHFCDLPSASYDPRNPMARLFVHMLVSFAEYERQLISLRTKEGLAELRRQGRKFSSRPPYGFKWEKRYSTEEGKWFEVQVPNLEEQSIMRECVAMHAEGYTKQQITAYMNGARKARDRRGQGFVSDQIDQMTQAGIRMLQHERHKNARTATQELESRGLVQAGEDHEDHDGGDAASV